MIKLDNGSWKYNDDIEKEENNNFILKFLSDYEDHNESILFTQ